MSEEVLHGFTCEFVHEGDTCKLVDVLVDENAKLRKELAMRSQSEQEKVIEYLRNENVDWEDRYRALAAKNARLRKACADLLHMAESHDPEWLHWPEMHDELRKMGVEVDE